MYPNQNHKPLNQHHSADNSFSAGSSPEDDSPADIFAPKGLKISLRTVFGLIGTAFFAIILWSLFISPTSSGNSLMVGMRAAQGIAALPGNSPPYAKYEIVPIRDTTGSIFAHTIAQKLSLGESNQQGMSGTLADSHGVDVVSTFQKSFSGIHNECTIRISAQVFDEKSSPYASLMMNIGSKEDAFLTLLTHEMAHCFWNPGPFFEASFKTASEAEEMSRAGALMPLVLNIAESYSDAYSLIFAARFEKDLYARAYQAVWSFRAAQTSNISSYNTLNAIDAVAALIPTMPGEKSPLSVRWDVTHRYVLSAALTGSMRWLMGQGKTQDEAIKSINEVLTGQGIVFAFRQVAGKDYLIVSEAAEIK